MYHCWYSDVQRPGVAFWGRANGWALLAQVDLLDRLPENHFLRDTLLSLLRRHIRGIVRCQVGQGLWHQLLDREDSYLETSCSAMFTYAMARAVNRGYIESRYAENARRGWEGVQSKVRPDGQIEGICAGTGVGDDFAHYYKRPTPLNDPHGIGAVLLAGAEVLLLGN
jgi:rhamnogalacturonyl hydrolase YesR